MLKTTIYSVLNSWLSLQSGSISTFAAFEILLFHYVVEERGECCP